MKKSLGLALFAFLLRFVMLSFKFEGVIDTPSIYESFMLPFPAERVAPHKAPAVDFLPFFFLLLFDASSGDFSWIFLKIFSLAYLMSDAISLNFSLPRLTTSF